MDYEFDIDTPEILAALVSAHQPLELFAQFFDDPFDYIRDRVAGLLAPTSDLSDGAAGHRYGAPR
jgi:hypothetical protein